MSISSLNDLPVALGSLFFFLILLAALETGYRAGLHQSEKFKGGESSRENIVLTSVLALLGLILAFTFSSGINHYQLRKHAVVAESNAIGTAFLRADLQADPGRTELKKALLEYARARAIQPGTAHTKEKVEEVIENSTRARDAIWPALKQVLQQKEPGPMEVLLVEAINEVFDYHSIRIMAVFDKLPPIIIWLVVFISSAALAVAGFNAGIKGWINRWRLSVFALVLSSVMLVIQDFDRPITGFIIVSHDSTLSVIAEMEENLESH